MTLDVIKTHVPEDFDVDQIELTGMLGAMGVTAGTPILLENIEPPHESAAPTLPIGSTDTTPEVKLTRQQASDAINNAVKRQQLAVVNLRRARENLAVVKGALETAKRVWIESGPKWTAADERRAMQQSYVDQRAARISTGTASDFVHRYPVPAGGSKGNNHGSFNKSYLNRNVKDLQR
jgi:hypothetical protein